MNLLYLKDMNRGDIWINPASIEIIMLDASMKKTIVLTKSHTCVVAESIETIKHRLEEL